MYAQDHALIATPVGMVRVTGDDTYVHAIAIEPRRAPEREGNAASVRAAAEQLREYFAGERQAFDLPLALSETKRGPALRDAMLSVGYGETRTYGALADTIGTSARAMGQACRANPFPIVVPCHRVLSAGATDHYSAGDGPATKQWLLGHERRHRLGK